MTKALLRWIPAAVIIMTIAGAVIWARTGEPAIGPTAAPQSHTAMPEMSGMMMPDGSVHLTPEVVRSLGVTVVAAEVAPLEHAVRTTGVVVYDETRLATIAPKVAGFVEQLHVNFTGQPVQKGQPLLEIYAPELVAAQEELLGALRMQAQLRDDAAPAVTNRARSLVDAARRRLMLWDVSPTQVDEIKRTGSLRRTLTMHAPFGGFVTEKLVQAGQAVEVGMPLYRLADLSTVWIEANVYEQDLRFISLGEAVEVDIAAYPREPFSGRISYIYPNVQADTRTTRVRAELANPGARIKPGMYATVRMATQLTERAVVIPRDAVMHNGTHAMVFVEDAPGRYRAREVTIGAEAGGKTQILAGLLAGEKVVSRANFLLDSESRLMDMGAMSGMSH